VETVSVEQGEQDKELEQLIVGHHVRQVAHHVEETPGANVKFESELRRKNDKKIRLGTYLCRITLRSHVMCNTSNSLLQASLLADAPNGGHSS
jgi:hypothetical protein